MPARPRPASKRASSALFAFYTAHFSSYSKTYGALASIVVLLLWLWLSSLLVLVGAEVDGTASEPLDRHAPAGA